LYQDKNIIYVKTSDDNEKVAQVMKKYNLDAIPVVDYQNKLVGRITIDDVVDIIQEEADKDLQLMSGISERVESNSSVWRMSRSRLPWLVIGMLGGTLSAQVISKFETNIGNLPALAFFIPLITAMGGNVGVQSSAIVVQSLARGDDPFDSILRKVGKESLVGLLNGLICSVLVFLGAYSIGFFELGIIVSLSLLTVIVFAAVLGTMIPLILNRYKIDPALATGPFVTTLNDIVGLFIYFSIGLLLLK
jgi:magnesium transporter